MIDRDGALKELIEETATKLGTKAVYLYPPGPARNAYMSATVDSLTEIGDRFFRDPPDVGARMVEGCDAATRAPSKTEGR